MVDIFVSDEPTATVKKHPVPSFGGLQKPTPQPARHKHETVADRMKNVLPKRVHFETQEAKEKIILLLRQHWFTQVGWVLAVVAMLFLPLVFNVIPIIDFLPDNYRFMAVLVWYLLIIAFIYEQFLSWFFDVWLITDERVVDIHFSNLLYKQVSEAKIDNIEDVTYNQGGVIKAMFDYGNVSLQTAAEQKLFEIKDVPSPNRVVQVLNELKLEEEEEKLQGRAR